MVSVPDQSSRRVTGPIPQMSETAHERLAAGLLSVAVALSIMCLALMVIWYSRIVPQQTATIPTTSGPLRPAVESGIASTEVRVPETAEEDLPQSTDQLQGMMDTVISLQGSAMPAVEPFASPAPGRAGNPSSVEGTGTGRSGSPFPPASDSAAGGPSVAQRWRIENPAPASLPAYMRILSQFGIEPAYVLPDGRIAYLAGLAAEPEIRWGRIGPQETRLFMVWDQTSDRARADRELFRQAGFTEAGAARLVHFFSADTEALLRTLEGEYQQRPGTDILRTHFRLQQDGDAARFVVVRQRLR